MAESVKGSSLRSHTVNWGGHDIEGFGESRAFSIEPIGEKFNISIGVDGSVARAPTGVKLYIVKINLLATSASNAFFTAMSIADDESDGTAGVLPFIWKDPAGLDAALFDAMWVHKEPTAERTNKITDQEWEFRAEGKLFLAGANFLGIPVP